MDAPPSRYRVIEKDGRLVVIDNATGETASSPGIPPPRTSGPGGSSLSASPVTPGKGTLESVADLLLRLAVRKWDNEGRAIIHWKWEQNGRPKSWHALLDAGQQRRLGRALVYLTTLPVTFFLVVIMGGFWWVWPALAIVIMPFAQGLRIIAKLRRETAGQPAPPG